MGHPRHADFSSWIRPVRGGRKELKRLKSGCFGPFSMFVCGIDGCFAVFGISCDEVRGLPPLDQRAIQGWGTRHPANICVRTRSSHGKSINDSVLLAGIVDFVTSVVLGLPFSLFAIGVPDE